MNDAQQGRHARAFGSLDCASEKPSVVLVNETGKVIEDFEIEHSALGWKKFREKLQPYGSIPFAIETSQGVAGARLFRAGAAGFPLQSKKGPSFPGPQKPTPGEKACIQKSQFVHCALRELAKPRDRLATGH